MMRIFKLLPVLLLTSVLVSSCVSQKKFKQLEEQYNNLVDDFQELDEAKKECDESLASVEQELLEQKKAYNKLKEEEEELRMNYADLKNNYLNLSRSYDALEKNSSSALAENSKKNRTLLAELEDKEKALNEEQKRLEKLQGDLASRSERIDELEKLINNKEEKMNNLRTTLSNALTNFEGKGLTVEQRDGKVYVSMENKLLFDSGSWNVGSEGKKAVQELAKVLAANEDIAVLIEGHTDDDPYRGSGQLADNWDLSTKRASEVLRLILKNKEINPENLTAAGRGEFAPVASNDTRDGKAKNRRIEVILTPKLDEISNLLKDM